MRIDPELWEQFRVYLLVDRKMSSSKPSVYALRSRFFKIAKWFVDKEFSRENINLFISEMQKYRATPSYRNKLIALCKHLDKYLGINQLQDYTYFKETSQIKEILSPQEIEALAGIVMPYKKDCEYVNLRQKCLIMLLGTTGSRIGEALNLQWKDIRSTPPYVIYHETKNGESRAVPIGNSIFELIKTLPKRTDYVFSSYRSGILAQQQVNLDFQARAIKCGITKPVYNHIFRHSYITTMLEVGVDVSDVARIVGHKNLNSTMRYKNSLLGYYVGIVQLHPLLKTAMSINQISLQIKQMLSKLIDISAYKLKFTEHNESINIRIVANLKLRNEE